MKSDEKQVISDVARQHCQGACETHQGEVKLVRVSGWGFFAYCEAARGEDEKRGLVVTTNPSN